jgi:hypothetical protein
LGVAALDLYFQYSLHPWRCQREIRLGLDNEQGLFPGPNHSGEKHQENPIPSDIDGSFDLSAEDNQLLSQKRVFCHECGLALGKVCQRTQHERSGRRFRPVSEALLKQLKTYSHQAQYRVENMNHRMGSPLYEDKQVNAFDSTLTLTHQQGGNICEDILKGPI